MTDIKVFHITEITRWARQHVTSASEVMSDDLAFSPGSLAGCKHKAIVAGGGPRSVTKAEFTSVNTMGSAAIDVKNRGQSLLHYRQALSSSY